MASNRDNTVTGQTTKAPAGSSTTGAAAGAPPTSGRAGQPGSGGAINSGTTAGLGRNADTSTFPNTATETGSHGTTAGAGTFTPGDAYGGNTGSSIGKEIKGVFAQGHGIGETIRGNFNAAVDSLAGDKQGEAKNASIANKGEREFTNKEFEHGSAGRHV